MTASAGLARIVGQCVQECPGSALPAEEKRKRPSLQFLDSFRKECQLRRLVEHVLRLGVLPKLDELRELGMTALQQRSLHGPDEV